VVFHIAQDTRGHLWFATRGGGASRYNPAAGLVDGNPVYIVKPDGNSPFKQDFEDFIAFAQAYDSSDGDDGYNVLADTDQNGTMGFADFIRFAQAYEREAVAINGQPIAAGKIVE
jgi:hypothetical protein